MLFTIATFFERLLANRSKICEYAPENLRGVSPIGRALLPGLGQSNRVGWQSRLSGLRVSYGFFGQQNAEPMSLALHIQRSIRDSFCPHTERRRVLKFMSPDN